MKPDQPSRTAEVTAAVRAWHQFAHDPVVFPDPFAERLTSPLWRTICRTRIARWLVFERFLRNLLPVAAHIIGRARYVEDCLARMRHRGADQYVLVGAGLDSFSLRNSSESAALRIFEVDHPATQRAKRQRLEGIANPLPSNLEFVPVDFERESLSDGLRRSSFDPGAPAFFSWLGVVQYLSEEATFQTLRAIQQCAAPGSEVVFDYIAPRESVPPESVPLLDSLSRFTDRRGEPLMAALDPGTIGDRVAPLGFELIENLSPEEQGELYFGSYPPGFRPAGFYHIARLRRA